MLSSSRTIVRLSRIGGMVFARIGAAVVALIVITHLTGCKANQNVFSTTNASVGGDGTSSDKSAGFRVRLKAKTGVEGFLHKFGSQADCEIPLTEAQNDQAPKSIQCMLEVPEYDLWFYGFEYEVNVPEKACNYVTDRPYYYYNSLPGRGPVSGSIKTVDGLITACTVDGVPGTFAGGATCIVGEGVVMPTGTVNCAYDYSQYKSTSVTPPNCCTGKSTIQVEATINSPTGPTVVNSTIVTEFGGTFLNCRESAHDYIEDWPKAEGKAATKIEDLNRSARVLIQKVPSTFSLYNKGTRYASTGNFLNSGFHDWAAYAANPATWDTTRTVPVALNPVADRGPSNNFNIGAGATPIAAVSDGSQEFRCLNAAGETIHRIRMYVNEWNTIEKYNDFKKDGNASASAPTVRGTAGVDCSAVNMGQTCNSVWGFDDLTDAFGAREFPDEWAIRPVL